MKKIVKLMFSQTSIIILLLAFQVLFLFSGALRITEDEHFTYLSGAIRALSVVVMVYIINKGGNPESKLSWIIQIAVFPIFGTFLYIFVQGQKLPLVFNKESKRIRRKTSAYVKQEGDILRELWAKDRRKYNFVKYMNEYADVSAFKNTDVTYFSLGEEKWKVMLREMEKAEKYIFLEYFIIGEGKMWGSVLEVLKRKAAQGVDVRVMYDGMGCIVTLPRKYNEYLERQGIKCRIFSPIVPLLSTHQNNRDHRKIMVIDGAVAFCGGINISDEYINEKMRFGHWKDTGFMLRGEAVAGFTAMFLEMWNVNDEHIEDCGEYIQASKKYSVSTDGFVIPFGDTPLDEVYVGKRAYINNLNNASEYTYIMTPYLVIDDEMYECMKYAAQRGVDVKIIMPHIPDKKYAFYLARTYYKELLKAGIEIYEYTPGFVHAKMSISDGKKAIVGTVNHDYRSLYLHYECAAYMLNVPAVMDIERDFKDTLELSQKITLEDVKHFNIFTKLLGHIIRLVAPLL